MPQETDSKEITQCELSDIYVASGDIKTFSITPNGIKIRDDLTFDEWRNGLKWFRWAQLNLKIALADYIKFGELKYGAERAADALTQLEFPLADITRAVQINSVPEPIRKHNLTAEHLVVLARSGLSEKKMEKWAETVVKQSLTPAQLKESIKQGTVVDASVANKNLHGVVTIHAIRMEAEIWLRRVGGIEGLRKLNEAEKNEILNEIDIFLDIYEALNDEQEDN